MSTKYTILLLFLGLFIISSCNAQHEKDGKHKGKANRLISESSPYLLQHAYNPVDWYPWGDEALEKAEKENKLLIISIGYAACHWCHVMEHESFEDSTVAKLMNENFVAIKVDREERPDIDQIYMDAVYLINQRGGWPLNAIALPNGKPVFAGTYFPKDNWLKLINYFSDNYKNNPQELVDQAEKITGGIQRLEMVPKNLKETTFVESDMTHVFDIWENRIDYQQGGRKGAPKFPMPNNYLYMLRQHALTGHESSKRATLSTLDKMAYGGIYDQLGGGFARYSTDAIWLVPHFEKMLYDNGQLVSLYAEAYQLTKNPLYKKIVYETLEFVERELTAPNGGFYSSLDADSEGEEGKFYVFTKQEIIDLLGTTDAKIFNTYYNITERGNWEHHKNILHRKNNDQSVATKLQINEEELLKVMKRGKEKLFDYRAKRIRPGLDDKILTAWNALMLKGYVDAYRVFDEPAFLKKALKNAHFLVENCMQTDFRLNRNYKGGKSTINAFLDDYSLTIEAFVALYQATFDEQWLEKAKGLTDYTLQYFFDEESGMFMYTSTLDKALIARKMEVSDNVIPSSNSSMAKALYLVGTYYYNKDYLAKSRQMLVNVYDDLLNQPPFYSNWAILMTYFIQEPYEIAILGKDYEQKRKELDQHYLPYVLLSGGKSEGTLSLLKNKLRPNKTMIYVCQQKTCKLPVEEVNDALGLMKK